MSSTPKEEQIVFTYTVPANHIAQHQDIGFLLTLRGIIDNNFKYLSPQTKQALLRLEADRLEGKELKLPND